MYIYIYTSAHIHLGVYHKHNIYIYSIHTIHNKINIYIYTFIWVCPGVAPLPSSSDQKDPHTSWIFLRWCLLASSTDCCWERDKLLLEENIICIYSNIHVYICICRVIGYAISMYVHTMSLTWFNMYISKQTSWNQRHLFGVVHVRDAIHKLCCFHHLGWSHNAFRTGLKVGPLTSEKICEHLVKGHI